MDFLLTAINGMRDTSVHDLVAAMHMLHVILEIPGPSVERVFGKYFHPSECMDFLLTAIDGMRDTSLHNSVAARHMLHVILEVPGPGLVRATRALYEILQEQACRQKMKELFPQLYIALLFHITYTVEPSMKNIALHQRVHNHEDTPTLLSSVRAMVSIHFQERNWIFHKLMAILNCRDDRRHILAMAFFIQKRSWILHQLMAILDTRDKKWHIPAMAFFIQLLQYPDLSNELEDAILDQMSRQLRDPNTVMRWLALKGLLNLALHPEKHSLF
ncbi:uncharacterized protein LOC123369243 [Mauremys mutica]|uniref:uncharacterized protein LOC123369243 n=1 Tax=Mauremys mutica TaxID=74926 RepID=UPI001D16EAAB|nr:uncharacterized protein LOC123369243 [Mauremys mutica]